MTIYTFSPDNDSPAADYGGIEGVTDSNSYTMGLKFSVTVECHCVGIRYYKNSNEPNITHKGELWNLDTFTKINEIIFPSENTGYGWKNAYFNSPVALNPGVKYLAFNNCGNPSNFGYYSARSRLFQNGSITNGIIIAETSTLGNTGNVPTAGSYQGSYYFRDVILSTSFEQKLTSSIQVQSTIALNLCTPKRLPSKVTTTSAIAFNLCTPKKLRNTDTVATKVSLSLKSSRRLNCTAAATVALKLSLRSRPGLSFKLTASPTSKLTLKTSKPLKSKMSAVANSNLKLISAPGKIRLLLTTTPVTQLVIKRNAKLRTNAAIASQVALTLKEIPIAQSKSACVHVVVKAQSIIQSTIERKC
jgi:Domain of unknown function (DUF4082)